MALRISKLCKLTISAFTDVDRRDAVPGRQPFEAQYNPETLSLRHESVFQEQQGTGSTSATPRFSHSRSGQLGVNLVMDGSGVDAFGVEALGHLRSVGEQIEEFLATCYHTVDTTHEPAYLRLSWGTTGLLGSNFDCLLQSVDIKYTAFDRGGAPLHAELAVQFVQALDPKQKAAKDRHSSPDLTHRRVVLAGDTLPLLCVLMYGSASHCLQVAEANRLDDFRRLEPGRELVFPPFARPGEG